MSRHRLSWLPEGEAPPPYRGVAVHRQPLSVQHSVPDLYTLGYRSVAAVDLYKAHDRRTRNSYEKLARETCT